MRLLLSLNFIAIYLLSASGLFAQQSELDSLRSVINPAIGEYKTVEQINTLADQLVQQGEFIEAKEWYLLAIEASDRLEKAERDSAQFETLINFSSLYLSKEEPDSALILLDQADLLDVSVGSRNTQYNLQAVALNMKGQLLLASKMYEDAISIADSLGRDDQVAGMKMNLASVFSSMGEEVEAMRNYYEALEYAEQKQDSTLIAIASNNIGHLFNNMEDYDQSRFYLDKSEEISRAIGHQVNLRRVFVNKGILYSGIGEFDQAESFYRRALDLTEQWGDKLTEVRIIFNLGTMEVRRGDRSRAEEIFLYTFERSQELGSVEGQYNSAISLGDLASDRGSYGTAARWYARAQTIAEGRGFQRFQEESYKKLYDVYRSAGNNNLALEWLERLNNLKDSIATEEKLRLQAEYETLFNIRAREQRAEIIEARQQEIQARVDLQQWLIVFAFSLGGFLIVLAIVLTRSNSQVKKVNSELEESNDKIREANKTVSEQNQELEQVNQIKNKLFAIIAHDLRGPLSSLQSLIYLIREHDLSKDELDNILDTLDRNIQENSSMMDNLLAWAKAQMNGIQLNERVFELSGAAKAVVDQIRFQAGHKEVQLDIQIPEGMTVNADYDIVKLVIRNLVANAIKFSESGDTVTVTADQNGEFVEIGVVDNGIGIKPEDQSRLFTNEHYTTRGTKNEKGSGLGLSLSKEFVEEHGGKLWFESVYGEGTTFYFTLPTPSDESDLEKTSEKADENRKAEEFSH